MSPASTTLVLRALAEARCALDLDVAWLCEVADGALQVRAIDGETAFSGCVEGDTLVLDESLCGRVVAASGACWVADLQAPGAATGMRAYIGVPVHHTDGTLYGTLSCAGPEPVPGLGERDAVVLRALAGVIGYQLEREGDDARRVAAAEHASMTRSRFLARMSHELRTPLNAILGFGQLLEVEALPFNQRESVSHILRAGEHLLRLVDDVLEVSGIEDDATQLSVRAVDLFETVRDAVAGLAPLSVEHGISVDVSCDPELRVHVVADPKSLKRIVSNVVSNAIVYNRPGGRVTVRIRPAAKGRTRLVVSDTGSGLSAEAIGRVFSPFERLDVDSGIPGTGLGLTLSRSLAVAMGGELTVSSEPGLGCDVSLILADVAGGLAPRPGPGPHLAKPLDAATLLKTVTTVTDGGEQ